jgi:hypothetical protein
MAIARISGPLLASNLVRTQSDLKFETDLLHIGSSNTRIGVRTDSPTDLLQINGQVKIIDPYATRLTGGNIEINTNGARAVVGDINLDSQANIRAEEINTEKLSFNSRTISSFTNSDIIFDPNGAGTTQFLKSMVQVGNMHANGNITIAGNVSTGGTFNFGDDAGDSLSFGSVDFSQDITPRRTEDLLNLGSATKMWNNFTVGKAVLGDIEIDTGVITTRSSGNNLIIRASGTGAVVVDNMRFSGSTLTTTSGDLVIEPGDEDIGISAAGALNVPHGTEAQRPSTYRDVRYNTTTNFFELFSNAYTPLKGIWSEDRQTYVLADNSNRFDFYTNGVTNVNMGVDGLTAHRLVSQDSITIDNGTISSAGTNDAINLTANGTGSVITANFKFKDNTITNTHATNNLVLSKTGIYGYIQFDGTYGLKIPYGSTAARPLGYVGATRFNTTLNYLETYDGDSASWANVSGAGDSINTEYMEELGFIYTLALG